MTEPAQASLSQDTHHACHARLLQHFHVCNPVLPADMEDATQASKEKAVESPLLPRVGSPGLAAVEECAEDAGLADAQLGLHREALAVPYPLMYF